MVPSTLYIVPIKIVNKTVCELIGHGLKQGGCSERFVKGTKLIFENVGGATIDTCQYQEDRRMHDHSGGHTVSVLAGPCPIDECSQPGGFKWAALTKEYQEGLHDQRTRNKSSRR